MPNKTLIDVINLHLKSRRPTNIQGHKVDERTWKTASGWAEGVFISSMKRIGQALETRILIDRLFDEDPCTLIAVCGDFNEEFDEVAAELGRTLDFFKVPTREKGEVLAAFAAHKNEVTAGYAAKRG